MKHALSLSKCVPVPAQCYEYVQLKVQFGISEVEATDRPAILPILPSTRSSWPSPTAAAGVPL